jgi:hypothetical protein
MNAWRGSPPVRATLRLLVGLAALTALAAPAPPLAAQVSDPPVVIDAFERARNAQNVDAALAQFADDASITIEGRTPQSFRGKDEIRRFLLVTVGRSVPRLTSSRHVAGNTVTWTERVQGQLPTMLDLSVEAMVRDGKIRSIVYRLGAPAAQTGATGAAPVALPAPLLGSLIVVGVCLLAVVLRTLLVGSRSRGRPGSRLRGRLLAELDQWQLARCP